MLMQDVAPVLPHLPAAKTQGGVASVLVVRGTRVLILVAKGVLAVQGRSTLLVNFEISCFFKYLIKLNK